ncbi:MAG: RDD family protein [Acidobacteriota bacterium]
MKATRLTVITVLLAAAAVAPAGLAAQTPERPAPREASANIPFEVQFDPDGWGREVFRLGQDFSLPEGRAARQVSVVLGDATIEGRVGGDVLVVLGAARIAIAAIIDGNLVVIGGSAAISDGAQVRRDLVVVGSAFDAPPGFSPGGAHLVIGPASLRGKIEAMIPWLTRGLLWGRLIVPGLPWIWAVVGVVFLVYLALHLIFHDSIRACTATLAARPLTAFLTGVLVLVLTGPVCLLLAISVVGLAVVPFVLCALFIAGLIGKVGVARWAGMRVVPQQSLESRPQSLRSFLIGFALITLAYMVPLLGFVTWTLVSVTGLGAAALAFVSGYRRENPHAPRARRAVPIPAPAPVATVATPVEDTAAPAPFVETSLPPVTAAPANPSALVAFPRAVFRDRLAAFVLDVILVFLAAQLLDLMRHDSAFFLLLLGYHIGFWTWKGTTIGGIICQLRVVRVDGTPLRFIDAFVRGLLAIFSLAVLAIGCLWMIWDPESQTWHDRIAGTYVVKVPRTWAL